PERRRSRLDRFHLYTGHRQRLRELLGGERRVDEGAEPVFGEFHLRGTAKTPRRQGNRTIRSTSCSVSPGGSRPLRFHSAEHIDGLVLRTHSFCSSWRLGVLSVS